MDQESLIGFDAREMCLNIDELWPLHRKETFLLKQDISKPLSTDHGVWSSVFDLNNALIIPPDVLWRQKLWPSWKVLEEYLNVELNQNISPYWTIAVTQVVKTGLEEPIYDPPMVPLQEHETWELLGYDISEETLLSGLLNFATRLTEMQLAREKYAPYLNNHHLFSTPDYALEYKEWCNTRDPGHGPFYVFGLYLVNKHL
jgi:hypothetical protein